MNRCEHPSPVEGEEGDWDELGTICGRPAVDKLVWADGSVTHLCAIHIDEWIDDIRENAGWGMADGVRDEARADLERNGLE